MSKDEAHAILDEWDEMRRSPRLPDSWNTDDPKVQAAARRLGLWNV